MKITFVSINSKFIHSSLAPWYLHSSVKNMNDKEITSVVVEGTINEPVDSIKKRIAKTNPDIIGFSCYIWNIDRVLEISKTFQEKRILLGGPEVAYRPGEILKNYTWIDNVLSGEGEWIIPPLLSALKNNETIKNIAGVCGKYEDEIFINDPLISKEEWPNPYSEEYFRSLNGRIAYFETSRGCPFSCAFCLSGRCGGVRFLSMDESKTRLIKLANSGTKTVKFVDRTFNANIDRTKQWIIYLKNEYKKALPEDVCFHFEIAGDILNEEIIELLGELPCGMVQLEIGLQSLNEKTLGSVTRKTNSTQLIKNIKKLIEKGNMHIHLDLIIGLPFEDLDSFKFSFNEVFNLRPNMLQVGFLKLLYGTAMRDYPDEYPCRYNTAPPYEVIETPWLSNKEIEGLHSIEDGVERIYNSGRLITTLDYVLKTLDMTPFDFFYLYKEGFSKRIKQGMSLNDYERILMEWLGGLKGIDKQLVREAMLIDRIRSDSSGRIPDFLRIEDNRLGKVKSFLNSSIITRQLPGVKRAVAILYSSNKAIYVDYIEKNSVTGYYNINEIENIWSVIGE